MKSNGFDRIEILEFDGEWVLFWYELGFELLVESHGFGCHIRRHTKLVELHAVM